ncbi:MAG: heme exporter protein CcmB [Rhodobacterales bacterium 12-64-8]|nr:MAG: heme exporter protein CcmB [Rhodobacterales bacterium 12-64-8]OYX45953.1 MAG: heme exporter protein CcmB [Alphaproteobacteria bacterium 32-64-14]
MSGSFAVFVRELKLAWSGGGGAALPVGFFAAASSMTPFAVGADAAALQTAGPGVMWIALALSSLLPMERLFQADLEDGTLDAYAGSGIGMEGIALAKTLAHWIATGIPLALMAPILWIMLQGAPEAGGLVMGAALVGSLAFFFFGSVGAALAAGMRRGGLLIALVTLPLYVPTMIFGAATLNAAANGLDWTGPLALTAAAALFGIATSPFGAAMALRTALD